MVWPVRTWRHAVRAERCLPATVRGPVDFWAFARLIAARSAARSWPLGTIESGIGYLLHFGFSMRGWGGGRKQEEVGKWMRGKGRKGICRRERYTQEGRIEMSARRYPIVIERTGTGYS